MTYDDMLLMTVAPKAPSQIARLEFVLRQLRAGVSAREVRRLVVERYQVSRVTAWRIVMMAEDLTE